MMLKQKISLGITAVFIMLFVVVNLSRFTSEDKNFKEYTQALSQYNSGEFSKAYNTFGHVSRFSKIKSAAMFRQALCAHMTYDSRSELRKYNDVVRFYPNSALAIRAKYLRAQMFYEMKKYRRAKNEFNDILFRYPKTDYALAAQYYLGSMEAEKAAKVTNTKEKEKLKNNAAQFFKIYLIKAPTGRFALTSIPKWLNLGTRLTNADYLLIAKVYEQNEDFVNAKKYLNFTNVNESWPYFVKSAYATKDYSKVKYYTELGVKYNDADTVSINNSETDKDSEYKDIYDAIDLYVKISETPKEAISYLVSIARGSKGYDYILYKNCNNMPEASQYACYNTLYYQYPKGQFAADALWHIFYGLIEKQKYYMAKKAGKIHLNKFSQSNSAPKVMFWMAKLSEKMKNYDEAKNYYKGIMAKFPDDYYAYRSFLNLNRYKHFRVSRLHQKEMGFPYKGSNWDILNALAKVGDYSLINQLCKDDDFIQSWVAYKNGKFSTSSRLARDAMADLPTKPAKSDPRWFLVYPIHYYDVIERSANAWGNDPLIILSIMREESYFNPESQSGVGAMGLMQLMPATAREAGALAQISIPNNKFLLDPELNIRLGNIYYAKLKRALWDKDLLAILAYNGGVGSVSNWSGNLKYVDVDDFVEKIPYPETQNYLKKVYRSYWNYLRLYTEVSY